jgi:uncharacterized SAM-binding protein YcdF (DUF218 family)
LGGSILEDGIMGESSYWRAVYAVLAWREGGFRQVVLSGGGSEGMAIVEPMRTFLESHGIPRRAIQLETQSKSTHENALYTKALLAGVSGPCGGDGKDRLLLRSRLDLNACDV